MASEEAHPDTTHDKSNDASHFKPGYRFYLAFSSLAVLAMMVSLDGTSVSVALPVRLLSPNHNLKANSLTSDHGTEFYGYACRQNYSGRWWWRGHSTERYNHYRLGTHEITWCILWCYRRSVGSRISVRAGDRRCFGIQCYLGRYPHRFHVVSSLHHDAILPNLLTHFSYENTSHVLILSRDGCSGLTFPFPQLVWSWCQPL